MQIVGMDHVQLAIPAGGEDGARSFFVDALGMQEAIKPASLSQSGCWFESGTVSIHVGIDPDFRPAQKAHPALLVDDLDAAERALISHGFVVRRNAPVPGYKRFFTEDPFGNRIEIMQKSQPA